MAESTPSRRARHALMVLWTVLCLPARIIEEGLHALAALPWARVVAVRLNPGDGTAETVVEYRDGTPGWAVRLAYVAPGAVAVLAGLAVIAYWLVGGSVWWPATNLDWILLALFGSQYLAIVLPSTEDRDQTPESATPPSGGRG